MNISTPGSGRFMPLVGILAPMAAVLAARVLSATGPAEAPAAELEPTDTPAAMLQGMVATPPLTDEQTAVVEYVAALAQQVITRSPMMRPAPEPKVEPTTGTVRAAPPPEDPSDDLTLLSVLGKGDRAIASISGRIYRLGDEVVEGWRIQAIDVRERRVTLAHADGRECILKPERDD